jgi:hypothetical protein
MEGIGEVAKEHPGVKLNVVESVNAKLPSGPAFVHGKIGQNTDPLSKIHDFDRNLRNGIGDKADIAFFKLCYIDINRETDVQSLFNEYKATMAKLARDYPKTKFVHVTTPVRVTPITWKTQVKGLLGKPNLSLEDNLRRQDYNELMRKEYEGKAPFFDLAAAESAFEDGKAYYRQKGSRAVSCLIPEYASDGSHLNERGRKVVAERLLGCLSHL